MNLSQAAQFDGPLNEKIEDVAVDAWARDFDYDEYCRFAAQCNKLHGTTLATLSQPEYAALCDKWETSMAKDFHQGAISNAIAQAVSQGTGVISLYVDENDNILMRHWEANMLYKDMHEGMAQAEDMCRNMHKFGTIDTPVQNHLFNQRNHTK